MEIDWIWGLIGGFLIGTAGAVFLLINGRVMGASGILGGLVDRSGWHNAGERIAFLLGTAAFPLLIFPFYGRVETNLTSNYALLIVAGLMVGVGTRIANGCTSGHGVCGISRLSLRGIVATAFYIGAGGLMMAFARHVVGWV